MRSLVAFVLVMLVATAAAAQTATLRVTVVDPSGAVIVGARVTVQPAGSTAASADVVTADTDARGDAVFSGIAAGRYRLRVESPGFEPSDVREVRVRGGESRRQVTLAIARIAETVQVGRDARERASDPRSDAFAMVLGQAEIDELPDDPDALEEMLKDMAGPGAVMRVNGFRGGRLPPKDQIAQIRFHRNMFAADAHEPGFISVDVITKPGLDAWRGSTNAGFRDDVLSARNAFAPVKGDERNERFALSLTGPLWKKHTSLSLSIDGTSAFDTKTIVAARPDGYYADSIRRPNDAFNVSARVEHAVTPSQILRVDAQRNHRATDNLGVGDFDLPDRAYRQARTEDVVRASLAGSVKKTMFNELRMQVRQQDIAYRAASDQPAVLVLNAFNSGGAQIGGASGSTTFELADDLDIAFGKHAVRAGVLAEGGRYRTAVTRNATGTFTFADLASFAAGLPTTFTRNVGDPSVTIGFAQAGLYLQDDYRAAKALTVSGGVRQELQSVIGGVNLAPRGGIVWSPFKSGKTTVRAGGGVFFDWFDADTYEQAVQLDGSHQQIETIVSPGYPDPSLGGGALLLPNGRVELAPDLDQPRLTEASIGVEQQLPGSVRLNAMLIRRRGSHVLRGVNVNAPIAGVRPDPTAGTITRIDSTGSSAFDGLSVNVNYGRPDKRIFLAANYMFSRSLDDADSPFSLAADSRDLAAERGPALTDARHRAMGFLNVPLFRSVTAGTAFRIQSALPYNITTGRDDNGDTISNDRPQGVTRNTGRGGATVDISARVAWKIGFGGDAPPPAGGPQIRIVRAGADSNPLADAPGSSTNTRYAVELYAQMFNLLNRTNPLTFSGVMTSPFFGQATSAAPARRGEIGARLVF